MTDGNAGSEQLAGRRLAHERLSTGALASSLAPLTMARIQRRLGSADLAAAFEEGQREKR